ncbi:MAG: ABC transporter substrate-binding protein, partial [Acidimicrobiales bacterium]
AHYSGAVRPKISQLDEVAFTSPAAEFTALESGSLTVGTVPADDLGAVSTLKANGYHVYGLPVFGFSNIFFNFKETSNDDNNLFGQLYIRQVLAHLTDEEASIKSRGIFDNAAAPAYGPIPVVPKSPFAPGSAATADYPFSPKDARGLLKTHGWRVVRNGTTVCVRAGSGALDCGKGIPKGTPIKFNLYCTTQDSTICAQQETFESNARQVGITISVIPKEFNTVLSDDDNVTAPSNDTRWSMITFGPGQDSGYPTTNGIFNSGGSYDFGSYSNSTATSDIEASVYGKASDAVTKEGAFLERNLPGIFLPNPDAVIAWKSTLSGPPASFANLTQIELTPEYWHFTRKP